MDDDLPAEKAMNVQFNARIAEAYGSHSEKYAPVLEPMLIPMAEEMVRLANLRGGGAALDLATGTGLIARVLGRSSQAITGIDISYGVLKVAWILSGGMIPFLVGDAHRLSFREGCFDIVLCGLSLSHFGEVSVALGEILRVLRPGGGFITSAWGSGGESPTKEAAVEVRKRFLAEREFTFEGRFNEDVWADTEQGCKALRQAGFLGVKVESRWLSGEHRDHATATEAALAWPLTRYRIAQLEPDAQEKLRQETEAAIREVDDLRWSSEIHYYRAISPDST